MRPDYYAQGWSIGMIIIYALKQIKNHLIRTMLAVLGVLMGTCAFIVLTNVGLIYEYNLQKELNEIGQNTHVLNLLYPPKHAKFITENDVKMLINKPIKFIIPLGTKTYNYNTPNGKNVFFNIIGIPFTSEKPFDIEVSEGRLIIPNDETNVTLSRPLADELSENMEPIEVGIDLLLDHQVLHIVGTHKKQKEGLRSLLFDDMNHQVVMNLKSAIKFIPDFSINRLIVILEDDDNTQENLEKIKSSIIDISPGIQVYIQNLSDIFASAKIITNQFNMFLMLVGGISLLIGGVGIMNIMLVVVTERQAEIGLRMAIGAKSSQIIFLFLTESVVICLIGGIIGILLSLPVLYLISIVTAGTFMFFPKTIILGVSIPIIVGLFFGVFPAIKAARMDPIKALNNV